MKHKLTIFVILLLFSISIASAELKLGAKTDGFHPVLYTGTITPMDNSTYSVAFNLYSVPYLYLAQSTSDNSYSIYPGTPSSGSGRNLQVYAGAGSGSSSPGGAITIRGGQGSGVGAGGNVKIYGGDSPADGIGGNVFIYGGYGASYGNTILAHDGTTAKGYVGIGTSNPTANLHIAGSSPYVKLQSGSTSWTVETDAWSAGNLAFRKNSQNPPTLLLTDDGLAIGSANPDAGYKLFINGSASIKGSAYVSDKLQWNYVLGQPNSRTWAILTNRDGEDPLNPGTVYGRLQIYRSDSAVSGLTKEVLRFESGNVSYKDGDFIVTNGDVILSQGDISVSNGVASIAKSTPNVPNLMVSGPNTNILLNSSTDSYSSISFFNNKTSYPASVGRNKDYDFFITQANTGSMLLTYSGINANKTIVYSNVDVKGTLDVGGALEVNSVISANEGIIYPNGQKICRIIASGYWADTVMASMGWTPQDCRDFALTVSGVNQYQLGCLTNDGFSFASVTLVGAPNINIPPVDCGWAGDTGIIYGMHNQQDCANSGGTVVEVSAGINVCRFNLDHCPYSWTQYYSWSTTVSAECYEQPCTSCLTESHAWSNNYVEQCSYVVPDYNNNCQDGYTMTCIATTTQIGCY